MSAMVRPRHHNQQLILDAALHARRDGDEVKMIALTRLEVEFAYLARRQLREYGAQSKAEADAMAAKAPQFQRLLALLEGATTSAGQG